MINKITLVLLLFSISLFSQVTNEGKPLSWKIKSETKSFNTINLPSFDVEKLKKEDLINDKLPKPWRFGHKFNVNYGLNHGLWETLENGDRIWRINFSSKGALSLNVIFDEFYMPEGAKVYLYNDDHSDLLGAYTSTQNQESGTLGTWMVKGSNLWIEYYEPANVVNQGKLNIGTIVHGYRNAQTYKESKSLGDSGDCNLDVDCPIGNDFEDHKNNNKKSVALLINGGGSSFCTGALVNNTANDQKGYFLTANHCYSTPTNWAFRFGWISPNPVCASTAASTNGPTNMTISGASFRARNSNSDFALVEINNTIPTAWDRTWAGWDKSEIDPTFEVGIHHPAGDIMKVCRDNTGAIKGSNSGAFTWQITTAGGGWELGVTEGGSSGSPLFDQNGRIIGQLYGGGAACSGTNDNNLIDYYGRFGISWDAIAGNSNQLKPWLDPNNTNQDTLDSFPPLQTYNLDGGISVTIPDVACGISQVQPFLTIQNAGATTLTNITINWDVNGGANNTINWVGSLAQNDSENIDLGLMSVNGTLTVNATISSPNGNADENNLNDAASNSVTITNFQTTQVHLDLLTDDYCEETTWEFMNSNGVTLYSGGPYTQNVQDNTHFLVDFDVDPNECYTFVINDAASDGVCCDYGIGSYELTDDNGNVIYLGGEFGATEEIEIAIAATASVNDYLSNNISIYPNPSNGSLFVDMNNLIGDFSYTLSNTLGQTVMKGNLLNNSNSLKINNITEGVYFMKITDNSSQDYMIKKLIFK